MAYPFELPDLGYDHDALEPYIDARTMGIHHGKHHAGYTNNLNAALADIPVFTVIVWRTCSLTSTRFQNRSEEQSEIMEVAMLTMLSSGRS